MEEYEFNPPNMPLRVWSDGTTENWMKRFFTFASLSLSPYLAYSAVTVPNIEGKVVLGLAAAFMPAMRGAIYLFDKGPESEFHISLTENELNIRRQDGAGNIKEYSLNPSKTKVFPRYNGTEEKLPMIKSGMVTLKDPQNTVHIGPYLDRKEVTEITVILENALQYYRTPYHKRHEIKPL